MASQAAASDIGFTAGPRLLFPFYNPYDPDTLLWEPDQGVAWGFGVSLDLRLFPGFSIGLYLGGLYNTDDFSEHVDDSLVEGAYTWTDLVIGALFKYSFPTGGLWRPWLSVAPGFGSLSSTIKYFGDSWTFENDNRNTGGFGLDAGAGVDFHISEGITVGFGVRFHINTADTVEYDLYGETYEWELKESPVGLGVGLDVGVSL